MFNYRSLKRRFKDGRPPHRQEFYSAPDGQAEGPEAGLLHRRGGGGQRHKRGFVKMAVLDLLAEQPRHGYEIIKELEQRYAGFYRPSPGSIYPILQMLEQEGYLSVEEQEGKKVYSLTENGRSLLENQQQLHHERHSSMSLEPEEEFPGLTRQPRHKGKGHDPEIRQSAMALVESIRYVNHFGTPAQVRELKKIIEGCSRQIHALLAQENPEE
ncbi:MAG TPA: PadR family transcriptional regulator [Chloroflexia bacterium]|nr:PadR family transcriptional regulator [Chloroflexia bacterium]